MCSASALVGWTRISRMPLPVRRLICTCGSSTRRGRWRSAGPASKARSTTSRPPSARWSAAVLSVGTGDNSALHSLIRLAPPGIDELFGILAVIDARAAYDVVLVDTAPTGHALRLLEMPQSAREWTQLLLRMLMKYRSLVRPGRLAAELVDLSKSIRELQAVLRDHTRCRFIIVTRAAELARVETLRLLTRLRRLSLAVPAVVVNARTLAPARCRRCRIVAEDEEREVKQLAGKLRRAAGGREGCAIIQTPISAPPPRGAKALERWADRWILADGH